MSKRVILPVLLSFLFCLPAFAAQARLIPGTATELPKLVTKEGKTYKLGKKPYPAGTRAKWIAEGRALAKTPESYLPRGRALKGAADNRSYMPPIGDQGSLGSCVFWAGTYYTKTANMKWKNPSLNVSVASNQCSPRFTYNLSNAGADNGGYGHEPFEIFMRYGTASLQQLPYTTDYTTLPSQADFIEGLHRRTTNYVWLWDFSPDASQIAELKAWLDAGHVAACGVYAETTFDAWGPGDAPWVGTACTIDDINHMVTVCGYGTGYYLVANQWGTSFGSNGYIVVDSSYFEHYFSDVIYPLEGAYTPATNYAKIQIGHGRRSDIQSLAFSVNGTTVWSNSPLPGDMPLGTGSLITNDSRDNLFLVVDLSAAAWDPSANVVTTRCMDKVSGTAGALSNLTLRFNAADFVSTNTPVSIPDNTGVPAYAWVRTAFETSAPSFNALGTQTATAGVATAFTVSANGYPVPTLALQSQTASSGYSFTAGTGALTYTPPEADIGSQTFTFTASNVAGVATQTVSVTVLTPPPAAPAAVWASATNSTDFTAAWSAVAVATGYQLDVGTNATFTSGGGSSGILLEEGFNAGTTAPAGWTFTAIGGTYTTSGNYGLASPSLKLDATGDRVQTPALSGPTNVSFWIKGQSATGSSLLVEGASGGTWSTITDITSLPTSGTTYSLPVGNSVTNLRFTYTRSAGNLSFDDVKVTGSSSIPSFVSGYSNRTVSGTSESVTGLAVGKTYYFRVRATGTGGTSANSSVAAVATLNVPTAPSFAAIPAQSASLGRLFTLDVAGYAAGYPAPAISVSSSTANGADYGFAGGTLSYTPSATGTYSFVFLASNASGTASATGTVAVSDHVGANYGVIVGLNEYDTSYVGSDNWLSGCVPDANHVYSNAIQRGEWTAPNVTRLLNSAGSHAAIRQAISNYAATAVAGDAFLYYHSSHGGNNASDDYTNYTKSVYLCTYDADYPDTELAADLARFASGVKVVVMVDACFSGGLFKSAAGARTLAPATGTFDLAANVSQIMADDRAAKIARGTKGVEKTITTNEIGWVTAADYWQYSWDGTDGGAFTEAAIAGWTNGTCDNATYGDQDGYANFYELWNYAKDIAVGYPGEVDPTDGTSYQTDAQAFNTNVLLATRAGWVGSAAPGGLVVFSNQVAQTVVVGQTLTYPVGAYTAGTNVPATVAMTTVQFGASYSGGVLTFSPVADGTYTFNFTATNANGGSASAALTVNATLAAPTLSAATGIGNDRFTANWSAVAGAASYRLDVATDSSFSTGGSGALEVLATNVNTGLNAGWEYVNGASNAGSYHKLITASDPGVVSPAFSTVGYTNALAGFSVATFGGATANGLVVSYSLDGGGSWTRVGTNTSATSSTYVTGQSIALPAAALEQASVRVKWHCPAATGTVGLRLQNLTVRGAQPAGGSSMVLADQSTVGTSFEVTGLALDTPYYYRVKAVGNTTGPLSATGTVTTTASDSAPAFSAIPDQAATLGAPFALNLASYVSGYPAPGLSLISSTASGADYGFAGTTLSFTPSATGTFAFVFRATNALGTAGATANVAVAESSELLAPVIQAANGVQAAQFNARWLASAGATGYRLDVATNSLFRHTVGKGTATLAAGDLVIVTVNADDAEGFDVVPLVDLDAGTVIYFTDNGWSNGTWRASEGTVTYTAPGAVSAGTVLSYRSTNENGFVKTGANFALSSSGDTILAYQGSSNSPSFLYGVGWAIASPWVATCTGTGNSEIPTGLSAEAYTIVSCGALDNYQYLASSGTTGSKGSLLQFVANAGNWTVNDATPFAKFTPDFTVGVVEQYNDFVPGYENRDVGNTTTCVVTGLTEGVTYYYRVKAYNASSNSPYSGTTSVVTAASSGTKPTVNAIAAQNAIVGVTLDFTAGATEPDGDTVTFACTSAVNVARWTLNASSGAFAFKPTGAEIGTAQFSFTATDKDGTSDAVAMNVTVTAPPCVTNPVAPSNGVPMAMQIATVTGYTYALQCTTNLQSWSNVTSTAGTGGLVTLQDSSADGAKRFYRIVKP